MSAIEQHSSRRPRRLPGAQRGLSLIELMIAMAISLGLMAALVTLVVNNGRAHAELDRSSRQIENGRYALELLIDEIKMAGFFGELPPINAARPQPDTCETNVAAYGFDSSPFSVPAAIEGFDGASATPGCIDNRRPDTAMLTIRRVSTETIAPAAMTAGNGYLQISFCPSDPPGQSLVFGNDPADFTLRNLACTAVNPARRLVSRTYFVATCSECNGDAIPTLKRVEFLDGQMRETPLAEGIEEIQFEYGFDTVGNDGIPDEFRLGLSGVAGQPNNDWSNVMAVRIHVVSRTTEPSLGYVDETVLNLGPHGMRAATGDAFKRRVYTALVRLNNPAGLRE